MAKKESTDAQEQKVVPFTDLMTSLDEAFAYAQSKNDALSQAHSEQARAVAKAQESFDGVKAIQAAHVSAATAEADAARASLEKARQAVNERTGTLLGQQADSRVSVR